MMVTGGADKVLRLYDFSKKVLKNSLKFDQS
jgi:hypothetical protein